MLAFFDWMPWQIIIPVKMATIICAVPVRPDDIQQIIGEPPLKTFSNIASQTKCYKKYSKSSTHNKNIAL